MVITLAFLSLVSGYSVVFSTTEAFNAELFKRFAETHGITCDAYRSSTSGMRTSIGCNSSSAQTLFRTFESEFRGRFSIGKSGAIFEPTKEAYLSLPIPAKGGGFPWESFASGALLPKAYRQLTSDFRFPKTARLVECKYLIIPWLDKQHHRTEPRNISTRSIKGDLKGLSCSELFYMLL
jgi:hypothetical protein